MTKIGRSFAFLTAFLMVTFFGVTFVNAAATDLDVVVFVCVDDDEDGLEVVNISATTPILISVGQECANALQVIKNTTDSSNCSTAPVSPGRGIAYSCDFKAKDINPEGK